MSMGLCPTRASRARESRYESKSQEQPLQIKMLIKIIWPNSFGGLDGFSGEALGKNFIEDT